MVRYVLLQPLRPEIDGQVPFQTFQTLAKQCDRASPLSVKRGRYIKKAARKIEPYTIIIMPVTCVTSVTGVTLRDDCDWFDS
jgi:hypothetical protein